MRGGKDCNNNNMEPLFPRLHMKDREKGGPKPPPRNKMAVYEELITPSSRSANGTTALFPLHLDGSGRHVGSSGQVGRPKRRAFSAFCCPSTSTHTTPRRGVSLSQPDGILSSISANSAAKPLGYASSCVSGNSLTTSKYSSFQEASLTDFKGPSRNEDQVEFTIPSLAHQGEILNSGAKQVDLDQEKLNSPAMNSSMHSQQTSSENRLKRVSVCDQDPEDHAKMPAASFQISSQECQGSSKNTALDSTVRANVLSCESSKSLLSNGVSKTPMKEISRTLKGLGTEQPNVLGNSFVSSSTTESCSGSLSGDMNGVSQSAGVVHKKERALGTTEVDHMKSFIISLDDVVLKIGQENFWKIRRILVNQERDFSIQVFELHRLVQVQRSLAGSSHHFIEDSLRLHKGFHEVSNKDTLPSLPPPPPPPILTHFQPNVFLKTIAADDSARESDYGKTTALSVQPIANKPGSSFNPPPPPQPPPPPPPPPPPIEFKDLSPKICPENSFGKHLFLPHHCNSNNRPPSTTNKFSPTPPSPPLPPLIQLSDSCFYPPPENQWLVPFMSSEGLVYKPYTGLLNLPAGCNRPCFPNTAFLNTAYGIPASQQGKEMVSGIPITLTYLDPCSFPSPPEAFNHAGSNDSTGSSSVQDALSLFPLESPGVAQEMQSALHSGGSEKPMQTIKAVPRDGRLATESVMKIFKSIQEERRQQ